MIRVVLAEDNYLVRGGVLRLLEEVEVGEFTLKGFPRPVPSFNVLSERASAPTPAA
jgi:hypothetical protein